ncbi:hypothetical protein A1O3_04299 [Capronia epimyces CBS 606.96]|uniref:C2H2-type domain-containing protein n=1 Tax=Capronia epimyces CBS 606.96 TaxID=1182542 RepID=W9YCH7_9EURO|nr:uncharacterized protein A1O3_04299 [Capronia epimyces CBS 606.96]EXJ87340.1 hypothetical protein A1O3_04299 [Capronia epimyces CBS 606.96]
MQASRNNKRLTISRQLAYVCPECQSHLRRQLATYSHDRLPYHTVLRPAPHFTQRKDAVTIKRARFSTQNRLLSLKEPSQRLNPLESTLLSSISSALTTPDKTLPGQSAVRDHLRAWSIENKKRKAERAESGLDGTSRVTTLPNSLFIEEARFGDEASQDDAELEEFEDSLEGRQSINLYPGDLIYHRPRGVKSREQLAIYMGEAGVQNQFFLADGRWLAETTHRVTSPIVRGFASMEEIQLIRKHLPIKPLENQPRDLGLATNFSFAGEVPHRDSAVLMSRLREFMEEMSAFRRDNLRALDFVHEGLAHDEYYTCLAFEDVVHKLLNKRYATLSPAAIMMTFMTLRSNATSIQSVGSKTREAPQFIFTPKNLVKRFEQVCEWARDYQECAAQAAQGKDVARALERNPLSSFIEKARRLILKSRTLRSPTTTGSLGPSSIQLIENGKIATKDTGETFSENDKMLLEFLWDCYIRTPVPEYRNRYHSIGSLILRAIGAYPKLRLERKIGSLLLQELGVLPPWSDSVDHDVSLQIPGRRGAHEVDLLFAQSDKVSEAMGLTEKRDHNLLQDSMASLRRDLGDMPVFCVDEETTRIRDDGYSIEADDAIQGTYWVHSHVAHPSAFITPDHIFARRARSIGQSLYSNSVQPMFPWGFSHAMSLRADSPALTVSTLLTEDGEVKDIKILPTRLRNVIDLDPAAVDSVLGKRAEEQAYLIVGSGENATIASERAGTGQNLQNARKHQSALRKLHELMLARSEARRRAVPEYANWLMMQNEADVKTSYVEEYHPDRLYHSYHYQGDPLIKCVAPRVYYPIRLGEWERFANLTTLVMTLAAESAAKWFSDRGIPAFFTGSLTQPGFPLSKLNSMGSQESKRAPLVTFSSTPIPHVFLSTKSYLRFTSPIRRFTDTLAHWQADAYLQAEANGLVEPGGDASKLELPYSKEMVDEYILTDAEKLRALPYKVMRSPKVHWALRALFRAFHFKEADLPEVWDLRVLTLHDVASTGDDTGLRGQLLPFQLPTRLLESPEGWEKMARRNSFLPVKIELVDLDEMWVSCRAVGPPSDTYNFRDPIRIVPKGADMVGV